MGRSKRPLLQQLAWLHLVPLPENCGESMGKPFIPGLSQTYHHLRNSKINRSEKSLGFGCHAEEGKNAMKHFNLEAPVEKKHAETMAAGTKATYFGELS